MPKSIVQLFHSAKQRIRPWITKRKTNDEIQFGYLNLD